LIATTASTVRGELTVIPLSRRNQFACVYSDFAIAEVSSLLQHGNAMSYVLNKQPNSTDKQLSHE